MESIPLDESDILRILEAFQLCALLLGLDGGTEAAADQGFDYTKAQLEDFWSTYLSSIDYNGEADLHDMEMVQAVVKMVVAMLRQNGDDEKLRTYKPLLTKIESYRFEIPDDSPIQ